MDGTTYVFFLPIVRSGVNVFHYVGCPTDQTDIRTDRQTYNRLASQRTIAYLFIASLEEVTLHSVVPQVCALFFFFFFSGFSLCVFLKVSPCEVSLSGLNIN